MLRPADRHDPGRSLLFLLVFVVLIAASLALYFTADDPADEGLGAPLSPLQAETDERPMRIEPSDRGADAQPISQGDRLVPPERTADPAAAPYDDVAIAGRVQNPDGEGLADVDLSLYDAQGEFLDVESTDEDGRYTFLSDEALATGFVVSTDGDPFADGSDPDAVARVARKHTGPSWQPGDAPIAMDLTVGGAPVLAGRVTLASTGEAVFLADVELVSAGAAFVDDYQDDWTDEQGNFSMALVEIPYEDVLLRITDDEAVALIGPLTLKAGERRWFDVELSDPVTLAGVVTSILDNAPVPDVEIMVLPMHPLFDTSNDWDVTGDDGSFSLEDVAMPADRLWLLASDGEHGPALVKVDRPDLPVEIRIGPLVQLSGKVVDAVSTEPIEDFELQVLLQGPGGVLDEYEDLTWADPGGRFELELEMVPPQAGLLVVSAEGYLPVRAPLRDYASVDKGLVEYEFDVPLQPVTDG